MRRYDAPGPDWSALGVGDDPWPVFEEALARHLRRPGAVGAMRFSAPPDASGGSARCTVQIAADASRAWVTYGEPRCTLVEEWVAEGTPADPAPLAREIVETCRDRMGVPHPELLTLRCQGFVGMFAGRLGLVRTDAVPLGNDPVDLTTELDTAVEVTGPVDVRERLEAIVERVTGRPTVVDDDGDLVFDHIGHRIHLAVTDDASARLWARVGRATRPTGEVATELARLNLGEDWTQWILDGGTVYQRTVFQVGPFLPHHAQVLLERFLYTYASTRATVAARLA